MSTRSPRGTTRTRLNLSRPQRSSVSVSASRADSVGSPSTTLITRARGPRAADPTSTLPAFIV